MRIQWSSGAAQEMLIRLGKADQGLADCVRQAALVRKALDEANVDGDNQALKRAQERFEEDARELKELSESLDDFIAALRRVDGMFTEAEESVIRFATGAEETHTAPVYGGGAKVEYHASWEPDAFAVIPNMRLRAARMPEWLENLTNESSTIPFMR